MKSNSLPSRDKFPYTRKKKTIEKPLKKKKIDHSGFSSNGLFNFFSNFDMFGVNVTLSYKGKQSYSTVPGIVASLIVLAIIGSFASYEFYQLIFYCLLFLKNYFINGYSKKINTNATIVINQKIIMKCIHLLSVKNV